MEIDQDRTAERDKDLVRMMCDVARNMRMAFEGWIQEELRDQREMVQLVQAEHPGPISDKAKALEENIDNLDKDRLPLAIRDQKQRLQKIYSGSDEDPFSDQMYLEESTFRLERMARLVFRMRRSLDELIQMAEPGNRPLAEIADEDDEL